MGMCGAPCLVALTGGFSPYYIKEVEHWLILNLLRREFLLSTRRQSVTKLSDLRLRLTSRRLLQLSSQVIRPQQMQLS